MKNGMQKTIALILVLVLTLAMAGVSYAEEKVTYSNNIRLPQVKARPTETPADETEGEPAEGETPEEVPEEQTTETEVDQPAVEEQAVGEYRAAMVILREGEEFLPFYKTAADDAEVLGKIPAGESLLVRNVKNGWVEARYNDVDGFVRSANVTLVNPDTEEELDQTGEKLRKLWITSNVDGNTVIYEGSEIILTAHLEGFEDEEYHMQWQNSADGGATFRNVDGATGEQVSFNVSVENQNYIWKLVVELAAEPSANAE